MLNLRIKKERINLMEKEKQKNQSGERMKAALDILNSNIGVITWLSTISVAVVATALKFLHYIFYKGYMSYWGIKIKEVSSANFSSLYDAIFMFMLCLILMLIVFFLTAVLLYNFPRILKIFSCLTAYIFFSFIFIIMTDLWILVENRETRGIVLFLIISALLLFFCVQLSRILYTLFFLVKSKPNSKFKSKTKSKSKIKIESKYVKPFLVAVTAILMVVSLYALGHDIADYQSKYRITSDGYAIIYETEDNYYLAEYDEKTNKIVKEHQKIIDKENVEYYLHSVNPQ